MHYVVLVQVVQAAQTFVKHISDVVFVQAKMLRFNYICHWVVHKFQKDPNALFKVKCVPNFDHVVTISTHVYQTDFIDEHVTLESILGFNKFESTNSLQALFLFDFKNGSKTALSQQIVPAEWIVNAWVFFSNFGGFFQLIFESKLVGHVCLSNGNGSILFLEVKKVINIRRFSHILWIWAYHSKFLLVNREDTLNYCAHILLHFFTRKHRGVFFQIIR